jgi:hypothetical protein
MTGPPVENSALHIDLPGLQRFASAIRAHVDTMLHGEVRKAHGAYGNGVDFGTNAATSGKIDRARETYHDCLGGTGTAMTAFLARAQAMATGAGEVARRYANADARAAATADDITATMTDARQTALTQLTSDESARTQRERRIQ